MVWGLTSRPPVSLRAFLRFPVCPPGPSPSSAFLWFPFLRRPPVGPFGRCPGSGSPSVSLRVPFPLSNLHVSAAAGRFRRRWSRAAGTKVTGSAATPRLDRAIRPHYRWAAAGHDGMSPQNRLLRAAASAGHRRARTAQIGGHFRSGPSRSSRWVTGASDSAFLPGGESGPGPGGSACSGHMGVRRGIAPGRPRVPSADRGPGTAPAPAEDSRPGPRARLRHHRAGRELCWLGSGRQGGRAPASRTGRSGNRPCCPSGGVLPHAAWSGGAGDCRGGHVRRDSSTGLIRPTSLPSGSATIAYRAPQNASNGGCRPR